MITYQNKLDSMIPNVVVPGQKFYVGSSGNANNSGSKMAPLNNIANALDKCTADAGDYIYLLPGYTEDVESAGGLAFDVSGVTIVGLGNGSLIPTISSTAAAATITVTADDITFQNVKFEADYADVAIGLDVSAVNGLTFDNCKFTESGTDKNYIIVIDLATGATDITVKNCLCRCSDAANDSFINGVACDGLTVIDSQIYFTTAQTAACGQIATSGNATNTLIKRCDFVSLVDGALHIDLNGASNTGVIAECYFSSIDTAGAVTTAIDATGCHVFQCFVAGEADSFGLVGGGTVYNNS